MSTFFKPVYHACNSYKSTDQFVSTNNICLHYLQFKGREPSIILIHSITANAHALVNGCALRGFTALRDNLPYLLGDYFVGHPPRRTQ